MRVGIKFQWEINFTISDLLDAIQEKGLPIMDTTIFCYELYLWFKMKKWELARHTLIDIF